MSTALLTIGQVASATGLTVGTIRYYDDIGLIAPAGRVGGKRRFDLASVATLRLIREVQACGFSLDEIRSMLAGSDWRAAVDVKLRELSEQRDRIDRVIATLEEIRACDCSTVSDCERLAEAFA